jgi:hypothetical protein
MLTEPVVSNPGLSALFPLNHVSGSETVSTAADLNNPRCSTSGSRDI